MYSNRVRLKINLSKLRKNILHLRAASKSKILAMIKANAYGHGMLEVHEFLSKDCDVHNFGLASIEEAVFLRRKTRDYSSNLIVFSDLAFREEKRFEDYLAEKVIPVISSWEDLDFFLKHNKNKAIPLYLKINTGMNRLGLDIENPQDLAMALKKRDINKIDHLMTHFSSSNMKYQKGSKFFNQYERFNEVRLALKKMNIVIKDTSVSNSGAIEQGVGFNESFIRPGILLYGASVLNKDLRKNACVKTELISSMETSVVDSYEVKAGVEIGYGDIKLKESGKIVLVGVGYGDGLPTRFSGASIKTGDSEGIVVGKINMDLTSILFPKGTQMNKGSRIRLWGEDSTSLSDISDEVGIIPYEILCNLGHRVSKEYII